MIRKHLLPKELLEQFEDYFAAEIIIVAKYME